MYSRPAVGSEHIQPAGSAGSSMPCCSLPCGRREWRELRHWENLITLNQNMQSIPAKFKKLYPMVSKLSLMGLYFGAICLLETWLASDTDLSLLQLPSYKVIHQGSKGTEHGRLIIYLSKMYSFKLRNLCNDWKNLGTFFFIVVMGDNLRKPLVIRNIYCPPYDYNSNDDISKFLSELSPVLDVLQHGSTEAAEVDDSNIMLLQINEREKFEDFFDLMCTNGFYPMIALPIRFSKPFNVRLLWNTKAPTTSTTCTRTIQIIT